MRLIMITLGLFSAAAFACGNPACGSGAKEQPAFLETITYALSELGLEENSDLQTAVRLYKKEIKPLSPSVPSEAFVGGHFNPAAYIAYAPDAKALKAQIDLFETIYLILDDEQKKEFPRVMGMYQHHSRYALPPRRPGCGIGDFGGSCDVRSSPDCGPKSTPSAPRKKAAPAKR